MASAQTIRCRHNRTIKKENMIEHNLLPKGEHFAKLHLVQQVMCSSSSLCNKKACECDTASLQNEDFRFLCELHECHKWPLLNFKHIPDGCGCLYGSIFSLKICTGFNVWYLKLCDYKSRVQVCVCSSPSLLIQIMLTAKSRNKADWAELAEYVIGLGLESLSWY